MKFSLTLFTMALSSTASKAFQIGARHSRMGFVTSSTSAVSIAGQQQQAARSLSTAMYMASSATSIEELVKSEIENNDVIVFSKSYCPFCSATKGLFDEVYGADKYKVIELDQVDNGGEIQKTLAEMTGQRTVPNTFIKGQHLGGNDSAQAAAGSGELQKMLGL